MALNPITVVEQVLGEYRSYLSTEFQARDPQLFGTLEAARRSPMTPPHTLIRSGPIMGDHVRVIESFSGELPKKP